MNNEMISPEYDENEDDFFAIPKNKCTVCDKELIANSGDIIYECEGCGYVIAICPICKIKHQGSLQNKFCDCGFRFIKCPKCDAWTTAEIRFEYKCVNPDCGKKTKILISRDDVNLHLPPKYIKPDFASQLLNGFNCSYQCPKCGLPGGMFGSQMAKALEIGIICPLCKNKPDAETVKAALSSSEQIMCPKCGSRTKRNGTAECEDEKGEKISLQNYKCLSKTKPGCKYSFVFEKRYDEEIAKQTALEMFAQGGISYYKIEKAVGYSADTIASWVREWFRLHPEHIIRR